MEKLTATEIEKLFINRKLILDGNYYWLNCDGTYTLAIGDKSITGRYEFRQNQEKIYFVTDPPFVQGKKELEVTLCIDSVPVLFD